MGMMDELNPENKKILEKLDQIEKQLNQNGTTSQTTPENLNTIEEVLKQQDLLMRNLSEIKKNEKERENRHNELLKSLEDSTSNFDESTHATKDNFMNVATSYLRKLDTDNQEQDRSEEHTSELQSRFDLVCRLLLEKKKTDNM